MNRVKPLTFRQLEDMEHSVVRFLEEKKKGAKTPDEAAEYDLKISRRRSEFNFLKRNAR